MQSVLGETLHRGREHEPGSEATSTHPVLVCLLGMFRLLRNGQPIAVRSGGRMEALLAQLGLAS